MGDSREPDGSRTPRCARSGLEALNADVAFHPMQHAKLSMPNPDCTAHYTQHPAQLTDVFIEQHRKMLLECLDGLSETEAKMRLVSSKTTLLGLVKHAIFVERVWFGEAVTGASRADLGIVQTPDQSFDLEPHDTIESIKRAYLDAISLSRMARAELADDALLRGNRRGPLPLAWVQLHVLRELAQHCGHADILREQILWQRKQNP